MGWFTSKEELVLDHKVLEREVFNFPSEIPTVGQVVKIVYFTDDKGGIANLESSVISREGQPKSILIRIFGFSHGDRIGTQEFKCLRWDRASKTWSFWHKYEDKYRPAILMF